MLPCPLPVSHDTPTPVRLTRAERKFFSDLVEVVCLSTVSVARERGASPSIGNEEIKRRVRFIAARLKASEREMFEQAVERFTLDAILDYLSDGGADGADVEEIAIPTVIAIRLSNGAVMVPQCPHCRRQHSHGPVSENGGHKIAHCGLGGYILSLSEGEAA